MGFVKCSGIVNDVFQSVVEREIFTDISRRITTSPIIGPSSYKTAASSNGNIRTEFHPITQTGSYLVFCIQTVENTVTFGQFTMGSRYYVRQPIGSTTISGRWSVDRSVL